MQSHMVTTDHHQTRRGRRPGDSGSESKLGLGSLPGPIRLDTCPRARVSVGKGSLGSQPHSPNHQSGLVVSRKGVPSITSDPAPVAYLEMRRSLSGQGHLGNRNSAETNPNHTKAQTASTKYRSHSHRVQALAIGFLLNSDLCWLLQPRLHPHSSPLPPTLQLVCAPQTQIYFIISPNKRQLGDKNVLETHIRKPHGESGLGLMPGPPLNVG